MPGWTTKSSPSTASFSPYRLLRFSISIIACSLHRWRRQLRHATHARNHPPGPASAKRPQAEQATYAEGLSAHRPTAYPARREAHTKATGHVPQDHKRWLAGQAGRWGREAAGSALWVTDDWREHFELPSRPTCHGLLALAVSPALASLRGMSSNAGWRSASAMKSPTGSPCPPGSRAAWPGRYECNAAG